jgi:Predicted membrane protein (DUF2306)
VTQNAEVTGTPMDDPAARGDDQAPPPSTRGAAPRRRDTRPWIVLLALAVTAFLVDVLHPYLTLNPAEARIVLKAGVPLHYPVLIAHILFGTIALVTVVLQLWPWIRRHHPVVHRRIGLVYVFGGALPCSLMALTLMPLTNGWSGNIGITMQAVLWFTTTVIGFRMARQRRFADHRRWMTYSAALALGVLWGRATVDLYTVLPQKFSVMFIFEVARWAGWMINLAIAQWWLEHTANRNRRKARVPQEV